MFTLEILRAWSNGSVLSGAEDLIPPQALRVARNVRLDRTRGLPVSRPGMTQLTSAPIDAARPNVLLHTKLYGALADWGYAQVAGADGALYRLSTAWQSPTLLLDALPASSFLSETNWVDGYTTPWKFFVGGGRTGKDNGTTFTRWGTPAPTVPPASASISTEQRTVVVATRDQAVAHAFPASVGFEPFLHVPPNSIGTQGYRGQAYEGTHNGPANSDVLIDTTVNFADMSVDVGTYVQMIHVSDGTEYFGVTTQATATQITSAIGWQGQQWQPGDTYRIYTNLALGYLQAGGGAHAATDGNETILVDSGVNFVTQGVQVGMTCWNTTTGGKGTINEIRTTVNPSDTLYVASGWQGEPGYWDPTRTNVQAGDQYSIYNTSGTDSDELEWEINIHPADNISGVTLWIGTLNGTLYASDLPVLANRGYQVQLGRSRLEQLIPGENWYRIRVRKSSFRWSGSGKQGWDVVRGYSITAHTNSVPEGVTYGIGGVKMPSGVGLEGEVRYTVTYGNSATGEEGSPPKDGNQVVLYSNVVTPDRESVRLDLSNVAQTPGPTAAGDVMHIYRQFTTDPQALRIATVPISTTEFIDNIAVSQVDLAAVLEPDNDMPPTDAAVLFGPGAQQRLFMIRDRNKLVFCKHWEYHKGRDANWPLQFQLQIGDGSQEALNGLMYDQSIFVWSEDQTWQIIGQGEQAYVPLPVPLSHGLAARWCLCWGDGRIFFLAKDGIYQQQGLVQQKITGDLDPFFTDETVHGVPPLSREPALMARYKLDWYPHPTEPELVLLYGVAGDTAPSRRLVLKKNPQSQQYTDAFFDDSLPQVMHSTYADPQALTLTHGTGHGHIWQAEVPTATSDVGQAIAGRLRLPARDQNAPRVVKTYGDVVVEANTGGTTVTVQALFNKSTETITAGTVQTTADNVMTELPLAQESAPAQLRRHHLALDLTWSGTTRVTVAQLGWHAQLEAEDLTFLDTGPLVFDSQATLRRIHLTYDATTTITGQLSVDGVAQPSFILPATTGRRRYDQLISIPPALTRGKIFRLTLTSAVPALTYAAIGEFEPEPLPITAWDSRDLTFDTPQILRQLLFDLEAPAAVTANLYIDGTLQETFTVGPTTGRDRINYVTTTGAQTVRSDIFRLTLSATQPFQLWGLEGVFEQQPLQTTFWDSREVTFETPQLMRQLFFDLDAPAAVTVNVYVDGPLAETFSIGPTTGRQRLDHLFNPPLKGRTFRVTMASAQPFTVWSVSGQMENEPLSTTFWDTRTIPFVLVHAIKWYALDLDAPGGATLVTEINGTVRDTRTVPATTGRQRINVWLPAGIKGRALRATLTGAQALQLWGWTAMTKELGSSQGYGPKACMEEIQRLQDKTFMESERRVQSKPLVQIDQQRVEKAFLQVGGGQ